MFEFTLNIIYLIVSTFLQEFVINDPGFDGVDQVDKRNGGRNSRILKRRDSRFFAGRLELVVHPVDDVVLNSRIRWLLKKSNKLYV